MPLGSNVSDQQTPRLLAILLGVFGLTVESAMEEFIGIYGLLFDSGDLTPSARAEALEKWMANLLAQKDMPQTKRMMDSGTCPT